MNIDAETVAKIVAAFGSLGAGLRFAAPFADRVFNRWLDRADREQAAKERKEAALERIAVTQERATGILETFSQRLDRVDQRLDRIEAHHGISISPSAVPDAPPHVDPRASLSGEHPALDAQRLPPDPPRR